MADKKKQTDKTRPGTSRDKGKDDRQGRTWADEAAKARTADDPRARTPNDNAGQPSVRSFEYEE